MKTNSDKPTIGYSAYCTVQQHFEYNENHCYVADSPESLGEFMKGCMAPGERYRPVPVTMPDILADYGVSGGSYCFELKALQRFERAAQEHRVWYSKEPFDQSLMNVDVRLKDHGNEDPPRSGVAALLDGPDGPLPFVPVTFSGYERPFAIHLVRCLDPRAVDKEMLLWFNEMPPQKTPGFRGLSFLVDIDPAGWCERSVSERSDSIADFVSEFLRDVTPEMKQAFAREQQAVARLERELAGPTLPFPDSFKGLLSYSDFLDRTGPVAYTFRSRSGDCQYLIEDLYCSNPDCDCKAVNLNFVACRETPKSVTFEGGFAVHVPLSRAGEVRITNVYAGTEQEALQIATSWCADNRGALDLFRDRYARIKEVGKRVAMLPDIDEGGEWDTPSPPEPIRREQPKVGRNDPCPCGSGKKYKKCCGRA